MKIKSVVLTSMLSLIGVMALSSAYADTPVASSVTATCNDGTSFSGATKKGACSGHKGVKEWGSEGSASAATTNTTPVAASATPAAKPAPAATTPATPNNVESKTSTMVQAPGGGPGMVWVNSSSKVYHCQGTAYYGKTKSGSYMTEADAKAKGNHADHGKACS